MREDFYMLEEIYKMLVLAFYFRENVAFCLKRIFSMNYITQTSIAMTSFRLLKPLKKALIKETLILSESVINLSKVC